METRTDLERAAIAAWHLCQSLLAVRDGATDFLIQQCATSLAAALGDAAPAAVEPSRAVFEEEADVELKGGIAHLVREFREIAEKANDAGLRGYKLAGTDYGIDPPRRAALFDGEAVVQWRARFRLTFRKGG